MRIKSITIFLLVLMLGAAVGAYFLWNTPRRNVANEKGIEVTADQLVREYQANEDQANTKFLDKAIEVVGQVNDVKINQEGKPTIMLATADAMIGVFCTLKEPRHVKIGSTLTLKGICSGILSDVRLRDAVVVGDK